MGSNGRPYEVVETPDFSTQVTRLTEQFNVDPDALADVLEGVRWALRINPRACDSFRQVPGMYMITTSRVDRGLKSVPQLRILFHIPGPSRVEMLQLDTLDLFL